MLKRTILLSLFICCWPGTGEAQTTTAGQLATEFCDCMEPQPSAPSSFPLAPATAPDPRRRARACLEIVALAHAEEIKLEYGLNAARHADRLRLANALTDELVTGCPYLLTLALPAEEKQYWSDEARAVDTRITTAKHPPADGAATTLRVENPRPVLRGRYLGITDAGELAVADEDDRVRELPLENFRWRGLRPPVGTWLRVTLRYVLTDGQERLIVVSAEPENK